jgi:hypothetical protein
VGAREEAAHDRLADPFLPAPRRERQRPFEPRDADVRLLHAVNGDVGARLGAVRQSHAQVEGGRRESDRFEVEPRRRRHDVTLGRNLPAKQLFL